MKGIVGLDLRGANRTAAKYEVTKLVSLSRVMRTSSSPCEWQTIEIRCGVLKLHVSLVYPASHSIIIANRSIATPYSFQVLLLLLQ